MFFTARFILFKFLIFSTIDLRRSQLSLTYFYTEERSVIDKDEVSRFDICADLENVHSFKF